MFYDLGVPEACYDEFLYLLESQTGMQCHSGMSLKRGSEAQHPLQSRGEIEFSEDKSFP